jgi:hypothetical protein
MTAGSATPQQPARSNSSSNSNPSQASPPEIHVTPLAAHVLSQLLLHGPALLMSCLPPPLDQLQALQAYDPSSPELGAAEEAARQLLALLLRLVSAVKFFQHELPLEEFLFYTVVPGGAPPGGTGKRWLYCLYFLSTLKT